MATKKNISNSKVWLIHKEAMAYLGMGRTTFRKIARENNFTISVLGPKMVFYKITELNALLDKHIIIKQTA